jgi:hypothetical protein
MFCAICRINKGKIDTGAETVARNYAELPGALDLNPIGQI